ncbi:10743_t:CDS:2 [Diversispora eburnea]|uniref:10743_t:CDS:1 n=1 Tax=Diversispora eburnea TaxID=1213867 RepID=A0A9N9B6G2_9GLOM|nr:10743_t:CDS:2 [Diversispora eburnea]
MSLLHLIPRDLKPTNIEILIGFLFVISLYIFYFYYKHFTRINPLPGPFPIPLIGSFGVFEGDIDAWFYRLNKEYGHNGVYELTIAGKRQIVITHAEHIESILKHVTRTANDGILDLFDLDNKGLALNHDYNRWKFNRRIFSQAIMSLTSSTYSPKLSKVENILFEEMSNYWINLKQKDENAIIIDIAAWTRRFICDFTSFLTTGRRTNTIQNYYHILNNEVITKEMIESEEFIENIKVFVSNNQFIFVPKLIKDLPFIKGRVNCLLDNNHSFYKRLEEMTVNTFCFVLYYISHNPNVKKKLLEEIKSVFNDDRHVTIDDLEKLKYCEAIIKEAARIRPTVIYRRFDVELVDMQAPLDVETSTFTFIKELNIKLIPRELKAHS